MPGPSARSQQPRDSSSQHHILADATVLAEALGCANTPDAVVVSLKQLAAEATLRYGMPLTARSRLEPALMLPDTEIIPFEIKLSIETPWKRLAEALRLPAIGELAIMAQL